MSELSEERFRLASAMPADRQTRMVPAAVALVSLVVFAAAVPFAKIPLPKVPAFIPIYESALFLNDLITAVLLFGQCVISRSRALGALASGYLYTAATALLHMMTFPGLFSPSGLLGAGTQSTAWIYMFWHGGFPLFVIAYVVLKGREQDRTARSTSSASMLLPTIAGVLCAAAALAALATAGAQLLPTIMLGNHYTSTMQWVAGTTWACCLAALAVLWRQKQHSTVDLWLMVVLCAWICDVALSVVFNAGRYDLGFYVGRIYGLSAASLILLLLLIENSFLHSRLAAALSELQRLATTDSLTGIANRRAFETALTAEWHRAARTGSPLSLLMIDIDFFKAFNDRYGHVEGDQCLIAVAQCLARTVRVGGDLVARYGGEEFVVLLPQTDAAIAAHIGQRMCEAVAALAIPNAGSALAAYVTVSIGAADRLVEGCATPMELTQAADRALYTAKAAGRGRVEQAVALA